MEEQMLYVRMQPFLGDVQKLLERMSGRLDLWEECVRLFPGREIINEMEEVLEKGDLTSLYGVVHRLKGNLANFGFDPAAEKAQCLLLAIKQEDAVGVRQWYSELKEVYLQIVERIDEVK